MRSQFTSYEQLPITLTADHVAAALGISRANAYILLRSAFPRSTSESGWSFLKTAFFSGSRTA